MAKLGVRTLEEMVGRTDLLKVKEYAENPMASKMNLDGILYNPYLGQNQHFKKEDVYDFKLEQTKDKKVLWKKLKGAVEKGEKASLKVEVSNTDRAFGSILGSEITSRYKNGLPGGYDHAELYGSRRPELRRFHSEGPEHLSHWRLQ